MAAKHEITRKFALAYAGASKRDKSRLLDEVCAITGWSRDNARRQLSAARKPRRGGKPVNPGARKYSYASVQHLAKVWAWSGEMSGKYLAVSMRLNLDLLEVHGQVCYWPFRLQHTHSPRAALDERGHNGPLSGASSEKKYLARVCRNNCGAVTAQLDHGS